MSEQDTMAKFRHELHRYDLHDDGEGGYTATCNIAPNLPAVARFTSKFLLDFIGSFESEQAAAISFMVHLDGAAIRMMAAREWGNGRAEVVTT